MKTQGGLGSTVRSGRAVPPFCKLKPQFLTCTYGVLWWFSFLKRKRQSPLWIDRSIKSALVNLNIHYPPRPRFFFCRGGASLTPNITLAYYLRSPPPPTLLWGENRGGVVANLRSHLLSAVCLYLYIESQHGNDLLTNRFTFFFFFFVLSKKEHED